MHTPATHSPVWAKEIHLRRSISGSDIYEIKEKGIKMFWEC